MPLHGGGRPAAVLLGPVDGRPPPLVEEALPGLAASMRGLAGQLGVVVEGLLLQERREVLVEPGAQLVPEGLVLGRQSEVHGPRG